MVARAKVIYGHRGVSLCPPLAGYLNDRMRPLLCFLLTLLSLGAAERSPVTVYLLGGQSNMQGLGKIAELPAADLAVLPGVFFWNGKAFEPLQVGKTKLSTRAAEFGPEVGFVRGLRSAGVQGDVYLIKHHLSGQPLDAGWSNAKWEGPEAGPKRATFYPGKDAADPNVGLHFLAWQKMNTAAFAALRADGKEPVVKGIAWVQGEADAKHEVSAQRYPATLALLRQRLIGELELKADVPFAYAQVLPAAGDVPRFVARDLLRRRMAEADEASRHADAVPGLRMVKTEGFSVVADHVHFDTAGQLKLGAALGAALAK